MADINPIEHLRTIIQTIGGNFWALYQEEEMSWHGIDHWPYFADLDQFPPLPPPSSYNSSYFYPSPEDNKPEPVFDLLSFSFSLHQHLPDHLSPEYMDDKLRSCGLRAATKCVYNLFQTPEMTLPVIRSSYLYGVQVYLEEATTNNIVDFVSRERFEAALKSLKSQLHASRRSQPTQFECLLTLITREEDRDFCAALWRTQISEMGIRTVHPDAEPSANNPAPLPPVNMTASDRQNAQFFVDTYKRVSGLRVAGFKLVRPTGHPWDGTIKANLEDQVAGALANIARQQGDARLERRILAGWRVKFWGVSEEEPESESSDDDEGDDNGDVVEAAPPTDNHHVGPVAAPAALPALPAVFPVGAAAVPAPPPLAPTLPLVALPPPPQPQPQPPAAAAPNSRAARAAALGRTDGIDVWFCDLCPAGPLGQVTTGVIKSRRPMLTRHFEQTHNMSKDQARQRVSQLYH